ncbi:MAG TPA: TMEM175 family protein, partial [Nitrososphaeraceae archaeon]|nr:TMEM175 family protein [Nitrososphaeraceae archaeon]
MVNIYGISKFHIKIFTDAVFGVAITILAVELQVPNLDGIKLVDSTEFGEIAKTFISYITTFVIIGIFWITYHAVFNPIKRTTDLMIWLNLAFLMFIAIVPFSIRLMNEYNNQNSFIFYSLIQILTGLILFLMWRHALRRQLIATKGENSNYELNLVLVRLTYI